jgi:hypothetical protein
MQAWQLETFLQFCGFAVELNKFQFVSVSYVHSDFNLWCAVQQFGVGWHG